MSHVAQSGFEHHVVWLRWSLAFWMCVFLLKYWVYMCVIKQGCWGNNFSPEMKWNSESFTYINIFLGLEINSRQCTEGCRCLGKASHSYLLGSTHQNKGNTRSPRYLKLNQVYFCDLSIYKFVQMLLASTYLANSLALCHPCEAGGHTVPWMWPEPVTPHECGCWERN